MLKTLRRVKNIKEQGYFCTVPFLGFFHSSHIMNIFTDITLPKRAKSMSICTVCTCNITREDILDSNRLPKTHRSKL